MSKAVFAIRKKLEEEEFKEDLLDLKTLRGEEKESIPFEDYVKHRKEAYK